MKLIQSERIGHITRLFPSRTMLCDFAPFVIEFDVQHAIMTLMEVALM